MQHYHIAILSKLEENKQNSTLLVLYIAMNVKDFDVKAKSFYKALNIICK